MLNNQTLNNPPQGGQTPPPSGDPPGQTPTSATTTPSGQGQSNNQQQQTNQNQNQQQQHVQYTSIDSLPPDIQDYIKRLRHENEEANKKAKAEAQAKQQAEEARLKEQGEWKSLAEKHEARVKELEFVDERLKSISIELGKQIDAEIKDWPKSVKALDPGPDAPIEQRLAWRSSAQAIVAEMQSQARGQAPGNPPNPRAVSGQNASDQNVEILRQRYQSQRGNPF